MADRDVLSDRPERHDPLTCELCHGEGVSAELVSLQAENERLRGDFARVIQTQEDLHSTVRRMARFAHDAHGLLTPGMKAGVAEAREVMQACAELARASDETEQPK